MKQELGGASGSSTLETWKVILGHMKGHRSLLIKMGVVAVALAGSEVVLTLLAKEVFDGLSSGQRSLTLVGLIALVGLLIACLIWTFIDCAGRLSSFLSYSIRKRAFSHLQSFDIGWFDKHPVGWLMARMTSDCDRLAQILAWGCIDLLWGCLMIVAISMVMLAIDLKLALAALAVMPVLVVVSLRFQKKLLLTSRSIRGINSKLTASFNESIRGVATTKSLSREEASLDEFRGLADEMRLASVNNARQSAMYLPCILILSSVGSALVLWVGAGSVSEGVLGIGALVAFLSFVGLFFGPIEEVAGRIVEFQMAQASAERVVSIIQTQPRVTDSEEVKKVLDLPLPLCGNLAHDGHEQKIQRIKFENVSFAYDGGQKVLRNFDFATDAGRTIALVGETGSGKSTLINLLCRFRDPVEGRVLINGVDLRERSLYWLQSNLGIVLQNPHLFSGTVCENIRYGNLDADFAEIEKSARLVEAHEFIMDLEEGYQTQVGEGGCRLSAGQRQLISFARAILADPQIFVMDEATSSIDTETEKKIQRGLEVLMKGRTSFVIAHRLSTIREADEILYMENGRLLESGTHRGLIKKGGFYHSLVQAQTLP